jgi:nuclease S1
MVIRFPVLLPIVYALMVPALGFGWGDDGHKIVCEIAFQNLSGEAKDFVSQLRHADPEHRASFSEDCVWADDARNTSEFGFTRTFHYINIPEDAAGVDLERDCNTAEHCVTWAIPHYAAILADASEPPLERARALKFLAHFVGDLHQPLHAGFPGDRGGNSIHVTYFGAHRSLHAVWDTSILSVAELRYPDGAHALADPIDRTDIAAWSNFDVLGWTNESFHFAGTHAYRLAVGDKVADGAELDSAYHFRSLEIVKKQLQRAGVRLAFLIERAMAGELDFP